MSPLISRVGSAGIINSTSGFNVGRRKKVLSVIPPAAIISSGLIAHLDAGNPSSYPGSGTTWTDLTGQGNNGTLVNGVGYTTDNGGALVFDGFNDFITLANTLTNSGNFTYCTWIYRSVVSPNGYTNVFTSTIQNEQYQLDGPGVGGIGLYLNGSYNGTNSNIIPLNTWVYICWQRNGTGLYGYINGIERYNPSSSYSSGTGTQTSYVNKIGAYSGGTSYNLNGKLGAVHMYNTALTLQQIQENFNATRSRFGV